jgi:hypothetical protein
LSGIWIQDKRPPDLYTSRRNLQRLPQSESFLCRRECRSRVAFIERTQLCRIRPFPFVLTTDPSPVLIGRPGLCRGYTIRKIPVAGRLGVIIIRKHRVWICHCLEQVRSVFISICMEPRFPLASVVRLPRITGCSQIGKSFGLCILARMRRNCVVNDAMACLSYCRRSVD